MTVRQLEEMDFFDLKLLAKKKGIFYVRDGEVFIYCGSDKLKVAATSSVDPLEIKEKSGVDTDTLLIGDKVAKQLNTTKDVKHNGYFWFWQKEDYFILCFVTEEYVSDQDKGTLYMLRAGNATDSL